MIIIELPEAKKELGVPTPLQIIYQVTNLEHTSV